MLNDTVSKHLWSSGLEFNPSHPNLVINCWSSTYGRWTCAFYTLQSQRDLEQQDMLVIDRDMHSVYSLPCTELIAKQFVTAESAVS